MANIQDSLTDIKKVIYEKGGTQSEPVIVEFDKDNSGRITTWYKPYTLTMPFLLTGIGSCVVNRSSCNYPNKTGNILTGPGEAELYHGDSISVSATAATGYNDPTVKFKGGGTSWSSVSDNVTVEMTAGSVKSYTLTVPAKPSGVSACTISRTSSPLASASTGTLVTAGSSQTTATIYYGDVLSISATAATGYNVTTSLSQTTVSGNVTASISALPKAYTMTVIAGSKAGVADVTCYRSTSKMPGKGNQTLFTGANDDWNFAGTYTIYYDDVLIFSGESSGNYDKPQFMVGNADYSVMTVTGNFTITVQGGPLLASWHTLGSSKGTYSANNYSKFRISAYAESGDAYDSIVFEYAPGNSVTKSLSDTTGGGGGNCPDCGLPGYHWCACYGEYRGDEGSSCYGTVTVTYTDSSDSITIQTSGDAVISKVEGWG